MQCAYILLLNVKKVKTCFPTADTMLKEYKCKYIFNSITSTTSYRSRRGRFYDHDSHKFKQLLYLLQQSS